MNPPLIRTSFSPVQFIRSEALSRRTVKAARSSPAYKVNKTLGHIVIIVDGLGPINFTDVGDTQIGGYSKATWGVLISYQGDELIFRYEGGGEIQLTINNYGQAEISTNGSISQIRLPSFMEV